jgi:hypothetical protein
MINALIASLPLKLTKTAKGHDSGDRGAGGAQQQAAQQQEVKAKATIPMWMCSKIMHIQREIHPTILSSLEGIVDQVNIYRCGKA